MTIYAFQLFLHAKADHPGDTHRLTPTWLSKRLTAAETRWPPFCRHFQMNFLVLKFCILIQISWDIAPKGPLKIPQYLAKILILSRADDKSLSEPVMV